MRTLANGDLLFPMRGSPPKDIPGFIRDEKDPYLFHLDLEPCTYRTTNQFKRPCGKLTTFMYCNHFKKNIQPSECAICECIK